MQDKVEGDHRELGEEIYGDKGRGEGEANRIDETQHEGGTVCREQGHLQGRMGSN